MEYKNEKINCDMETIIKMIFTFNLNLSNVDFNYTCTQIIKKYENIILETENMNYEKYMNLKMIREFLLKYFRFWAEYCNVHEDKNDRFLKSEIRYLRKIKIKQIRKIKGDSINIDFKSYIENFFGNYSNESEKIENGIRKIQSLKMQNFQCDEIKSININFNKPKSFTSNLVSRIELIETFVKYQLYYENCKPIIDFITRYEKIELRLRNKITDNHCFACNKENLFGINKDTNLNELISIKQCKSYCLTMWCNECFNASYNTSVKTCFCDNQRKFLLVRNLSETSLDKLCINLL